MWYLAALLISIQITLIFAQSSPLLLLVSLDGFRHDYPKIHGPLKNFRRLEERGVHAQNMIPSFVTATFPNHYTMVTGLYEDVHGVVSNQMFDPKTNVTFDSSGNMTNGDWWPHRTIWSINEKRSGARSGVVGWPQEPIRISKFQPFSRKVPFRDLIDQVLHWFNDPNEPINFGSIYFFEPDLTGHKTGPYSQNMTKAVRDCDEHLGYLLDKIDANENLRKNLHLIVASDHGMEQVNGTDHPLYIEDYIDTRKAKAYGIPPAMNIFVESKNDIDLVLKNLSKIPHSQSYRRKDIPERYHYKNSERIGDILLVFEPGYEILRDPRYGGKKYDLSRTHGNHGYDNRHDSMKAIFYATGPQLKQNFTLDNSSTLYNVDLFGLMCLLLNIDECPPSNGSLENIKSFLIDPIRVSNMNRRLQRTTTDFVIYSIDKTSMDIRVGILFFLLALLGIVLIVIMAIVWSVTSLRSMFVIRNSSCNNPAKNMQHNQHEFSPINRHNLTSQVDNA
ncbi:unnamed protein product [Rotaria socialis]|uniref:Uncharacterized protein n=2 Tax=Rotaria TaxID=231623 RepID=A0A817QI27_9BILA|nr:unnamed protein product [Rotaria socialis]CAF3441315.1 unnamed protein product [Rotaria socialis]CAF3535760.1 unnamed protein product [Rotaria socialis]CAF3624913.1 unnamed protein product [Rotaria socialis]CAF3780032.1 unnamed protein product [Rotaria socialis]